MRRILCKNCDYEWNVEPDDGSPVAEIKCPGCESIGTSEEITKEKAESLTEPTEERQHYDNSDEPAI